MGDGLGITIGYPNSSWTFAGSHGDAAHMIRKSTGVLCLTAILAAACSSATGPPQGGAVPDAPAPAGAAQLTPSAPPGDTVPADHRALVEHFVKSINMGDAEEVAGTFAPDARFDSVGRIYDGRTEIMDRFLVPEVIRVGGRYTLLRLTPGADGRVVAEYDFVTGGGGREHFTYDCSIREGRFADCVGRYV